MGAALSQPTLGAVADSFGLPAAYVALAGALVGQVGGLAALSTALLGQHVAWYLSRASAFVAYVLLWWSMVLSSRSLIGWRGSGRIVLNTTARPNRFPPIGRDLHIPPIDP